MVPHAIVYESNAFHMEHNFTSDDLVRGHSDIVEGHLRYHPNDLHKTCKTMQTLPQLKICGHFQI